MCSENKEEKEKELLQKSEEIKELKEDLSSIFLKSNEGKHVFGEIYQYALKQLEQMYDRKRHIETKGLYLLQGQMIVVTIYLAIIPKGELNLIKKIILIVLLVIMIISIFFTILVQRDDILKYGFVKKMMKEKYDVVIKDEAFHDLPSVDNIIKHVKEMRSAKEFYERISKSINTSINGIDNVNYAKNHYLNKAIIWFLLALFIISIVGIVILGG